MKKLCLFLAALVSCVPAIFAAGDAVLRPGDSFELAIGGVPAPEMTVINHNYTIDGDGYVNLPYVHKVHVVGLAPSDIQSRVERAYVDGGYFTHPSITLTIAAASRLVTVGGEVNAKGRVPYTADMTVMSAIGAAGDFTIYADQRKVRLIRGTTVQFIDCKKIRGKPSLDVAVLPGDNIQVPTGMW